MRRVESCWHACPTCHKDWCHEVPVGSAHLDDYYRPCAECRAAGRAVPTRKPRPTHPGEGEPLGAVDDRVIRAIDLGDAKLLEVIR